MPVENPALWLVLPARVVSSLALRGMLSVFIEPPNL